MKCEKITIEVFMDAWFNEDFENLSKGDFDIVYSEYIDLSGLFQSREFELFTYINYLKNRIIVLKTVVSSQLMFLETFKEPYVNGFFIFDSFGYKVTWNGDEKYFKSQIKKIEARERAKSLELKRKEFEFEELKKAKENNDYSLVQSRHDFIRMLNSFNKSGYRIDRKQTTVEELALIIKQVKDESTKLALDRLQH